MADIELVIKIPKAYYENLLKNCSFSSEEIPVVSLAIATGIQLPKGHGDLIDADKLKNDAQTMTEWNGDVFRCVTEYTINTAPTVIEADKADKGVEE